MPVRQHGAKAGSTTMARIMRRRNLCDATVVITGASSGIGEATAEAFAQAGSRVVLAARDPNALEAVAEKCRSLGGAAHVVPTDVTDAQAVRALAAEARSLRGRIDVWLSNVGVGAVGRFHETPMSAHEQVIRANLVGHMNDAHAVLPIFLEQGYGTFINMISLGGFVATPFAAAYSASKFGLRGFSEALRAELAGHSGIHVCDVYPTFVDTPAIRHSANYIGRALSAPPPVYDPRRVAAAVVSLANHPRPKVIVGAPTHLVRFAHLVAPDATARLMARLMEAYFRWAPAARATDGNLFSPPAEAGGIEGNLRSRGQRSLALVAGVTAALVLAARLSPRRSRR